MKKIIALLLTLSAVFYILSGFCAFSFSASSLALYEVSSATFLIEKNADRIRPMASTTKIMTALVTLENADLNAELKIPSVATGVEGSSMYLVKDEPLTVKELLYGLMLTSGNDAATALAYYVGGGSIDAFVKLMNDKAALLGLENTHFTNPSGLPDDKHYTTAKELAMLTAAALENPVFCEIVSCKSIQIRRNGVEKGRTLTNHNKMLSLYEGAIGVKTGFTKKAGRCLVSAAARDGVTLVCVTLNAPDDWNDHTAALDSGFARSEHCLLAKKDSITVALKTAAGDTVYAKNKTELTACVFDGEMPTQQIYAPAFVYPPASEGDIVGRVEYQLDGKPVCSSDLYIETDVQAPAVKDLWITKIIRFLRNLF